MSRATAPAILPGQEITIVRRYLLTFPVITIKIDFERGGGNDRECHRSPETMRDIYRVEQ